MKITKALFPLMALILVGVVVLAGYWLMSNEQKDQTRRMEICVSNGGEWIRDHGSYYECRR